jgi:hypothetical protein
MKQDENTAVAGLPATRLDDFQAVVLDGPDAITFAQAQLAADLRPLATGAWCWAAWLDAPGRMLALFLAARTAPERLELWAPGARAAELASGLARYVLRSKVKVTTAQGGALGLRRGDAGASPHALHALHALHAGGVLEGLPAGPVAWIGGRADRGLLLAAFDDGAADPQARETWTALDVDDRLPWIVGAGAGQWIPQSLGLGALAAYSTAKGCYPGQEIVARTHFLGRNKRRLLQGTFDGPLPVPGERLLDADGKPAGEVVIAAGGHFLAVAHEDAPPVARTAQGAAARAQAVDPVSSA